MRPRVIFTTTVFDEVQNGPGIYAQYLWQAFRDDPEIEFHLVAPSAEEKHPRLHAQDSAAGRGMGRRINALALELSVGKESETIQHGNMAHVMGAFATYPGPWVAQVNDYEVATLWQHVAGTILRHGPRRLAALTCRRRQEKKLLPKATRVVCNSECTRRQVLSAYRVDPDRTVTIHKAVDASSFTRPATLPPDPLPDRPAGARLVFVGTNWQVKAVDVLLKALRDVSRDVPNVTLAVAGQDLSKAATRVRSLCEKLGLSDRVTFLGRVDRDRLPELIWHSDVFVLPSRMEAFGVAVLEALAAGAPVVATDVGGIPEIVRDGVDGLLVPADDPVALAGAIRKVVSDEPLKRRLAEAAPPRAEAFSVARMIASLRKLYLELLAN